MCLFKYFFIRASIEFMHTYTFQRSFVSKLHILHTGTLEVLVNKTHTYTFQRSFVSKLHILHTGTLEVLVNKTLLMARNIRRGTITTRSRPGRTLNDTCQ
jgi:hypothetical protein